MFIVASVTSVQANFGCMLRNLLGRMIESNCRSSHYQKCSAVLMAGSWTSFPKEVYAT